MDELGVVSPTLIPPFSSAHQANQQTSAYQQNTLPSIPVASVQPGLHSISAYLSLPREPETWLIEPLLPRGGSLLLYGDAKVGKSFAALQLASDLSLGQDWLGFHVPEQAKVAYIQLDTPRSLWADRLEKLLSRGLDCSGPLFQADRESLGLWPFDVLDPAHQSFLHSLLAPHNLDCVIVDTLREAHTGDENDSTEMQAVIAQLTAAVKPAALIIISHSRKSNPEIGYDLMNDNRGSNYIVGRMDAICRMSHTSLRISGRSIDEQSIPLLRREDGLWELAHDVMAAPADKLLATNQPLRELARLLKVETGKSEQACRAYLRRRQEKLAKGQS